MVEIIIIGSIIGLFLIFGILFYSGKAAFLIAGYNTMSPEEKAKIDEGNLLKTMGKLMFGLAFSMSFWIASSLFQIEWLFYVGLALFLILTITTIIRVNTSSKYRKVKK